MAKVAFSKLKCKINETEVPVQIGEETVMVKQYLPIQDKLALIGRVIERAHEEDYNFSNPVKADVIAALEIIFAYTNILFTDKQKEDFAKLYDLLVSNNILTEIMDHIPSSELTLLREGIQNTTDAFYQYQNSVLGLLDGIKKSYSASEFDVEMLQKTITELQNNSLIKDILPLIGLE